MLTLNTKTMKKKLLTLIAAVILTLNLAAQDSKIRETEFEYTKSLVLQTEKEITYEDIKMHKEKEFRDDERKISIDPVKGRITFDFGTVVKSMNVMDDDFLIIDNEMRYKLGDADYAYVTIGEDYAIITMENDMRTLVLLTDKFNWK